MRVLAALAIVLSVSTSLVAAPILSIDLLPAQYIPGQDMEFEVKLAGATDLAAFNIDLILSTPTAEIGVDARFEPPVPNDRYVFGVGPDHTALFSAIVDTIGDEHFLNVSDFHDHDGDFVLDPVSTVAGVNDVVARVTLKTTPDMTGSLLIAIDPNTLELDTHEVDGGGQPILIAGFETLLQGVSGDGPIEITQIPEPAVTALLLAGIWSFAGKRSRRRC